MHTLRMDNTCMKDVEGVEDGNAHTRFHDVEALHVLENVQYWMVSSSNLQF